MDPKGLALYIRGLRAEDPKPDAEPGTPIHFIASSEGVKRDGIDITIEQWDLRNYKQNPVVLWGHDYGGWGVSPRPPIGRATVSINKERRTLDASIIFDIDDPFAADIERKYRRGFLNAVSVGWNFMLPAGKSSLMDVPRDEIRADLLDISGVPVPGDPDALKERYYEARSFDRTITGGPQPPHSSAICVDTTRAYTPDLRNLKVTQLRALSAWVDPAIHPDSLFAYRFLHHDTTTGEAVWSGVAAAMAELYLASAQMPEEDREGVYRHLSRHYNQFRKEPPDWLTGEEIARLDIGSIRGLFFADEPALVPHVFERAGAVLSKRNLGDLEQAIDLLSGIRERSIKATPEEEPEEPVKVDERAVSELRGLFDGLNTRVVATQ